jgi:hypothetical protein
VQPPTRPAAVLRVGRRSPPSKEQSTKYKVQRESQAPTHRGRSQLIGSSLPRPDKQAKGHRPAEEEKEVRTSGHLRDMLCAVSCRKKNKCQVQPFFGGPGRKANQSKRRARSCYNSRFLLELQIWCLGTTMWLDRVQYPRCAGNGVQCRGAR